LLAGLFGALLRLRRGLIPKICTCERGANKQGAASRAERASNLPRGEEDHAVGLHELIKEGIVY
jgi:hypothetical protein